MHQILRSRMAGSIAQELEPLEVVKMMEAALRENVSAQMDLKETIAKQKYSVEM